MELLSNLGINGKLLFAQAVNFLLVVFLLNRFVFRKLLAFLEQRRQHIEKGVELRERAEREVALAKDMRRQELQKAQQEGEGIVEEAKVQAQQKMREALLAAKAEREKKLLEVQGETQRIKEETLKNAKNEIQNRALAFAEKILERTLSAKDQNRMLKEVLKDENIESYAK